MKPTALKTLIITCWTVLVVCMIIKLLGGNWFELATNNAKFIQFCEFVDNTMWLKMIIYCNVTVITSYPLFCIILNKKYLTTKETILFISIIVIKSILGWRIIWISYVADLVSLIILPLLFGKFKNWKRVLITNILVMILQLICMFIRSLSFNFATLSEVLETLLIQLDYFIMVILSYLYNIKYFINKKEV